MIKLILVTAHEEQAFCALLVDYHHGRTKFKLDLVEHSPATYGLGVKTVENFGEKARLQTTGCKCQQLR